MNFYTLITNVGKSKIANATVLGEKVALKTIQVGDGGGQYYEPSESQTQLRNKVWEGQIGKIEVDTDNPNWIITESVIPSKVGGFTIREVGIFDTEGDLIIIAKYPETYKPQLADGSTKDLILRTIIEVTNAESIALKIDATVVLATKKDIDVLEQKLNKKIEGITVPVTSVNEKTGAIVLKAKDIECDDMHTIEQNITELQDQFEALELTAEKVTITDHDGNFVGENVEEALRENATKIKQAKQEATTATEKANAAQQSANVAQQSANNAKNQADTALQRANEAFQNGVNVKDKLVRALASKGINLTITNSWQEITDKINSLKAITKTFKSQWKANINTPPNNTGTNNVVLTNDGYVYCALGNKIRKFNKELDNIKTYNTNLNEIVGITVDEKNNIYCVEYSSNNAKVTKLNSTGDMVWSNTIGREGGEILYHDGKIFIARTNGITAKEVNNAGTIWEKTISDSPYSVARGLSYLRHDNNDLLLFTTDKRFTGISMTNGSEVVTREITSSYRSIKTGTICLNSYIILTLGLTAYYWNNYWNGSSISVGPELNTLEIIGASNKSDEIFGFTGNKLYSVLINPDNGLRVLGPSYVVEDGISTPIKKVTSMRVDDDGSIFALGDNGFLYKIIHIYGSIKL